MSRSSQRTVFGRNTSRTFSIYFFYFRNFSLRASHFRICLTDTLRFSYFGFHSGIVLTYRTVLGIANLIRKVLEFIICELFRGSLAFGLKKIIQLILNCILIITSRHSVICLGIV